MTKQPLLQGGKLFDVFRSLGPQHIRVTSCRAGRGAGSVEKRRIEQGFRLEVRHVDFLGLGLEPQPLEIALQPAQAAAGLVQRRHFGAGKNELGRLAARCGAEIDGPLALEVAKQSSRDRCSRVLDPPAAIIESG
ncbi:hypothetical protein D3C87_1774350 [compost metagenome]